MDIVKNSVMYAVKIPYHIAEFAHSEECEKNQGSQLLFFAFTSKFYIIVFRA